MANVNIIFGGSIQVTTAVVGLPSSTLVNTTTGSITLSDVAAFYDPYFQVLTTGSAVPLPGATAYSVYIKNLGTNNVTVAWTPAGGVSATIGVLIPGAALLFWTPGTGTPAAGGISALTLTAATATTPVEVLVGA